MKKVLRKFVYRQLAKKGLTISIGASKKMVVELIKSLHPRKTQFELLRFGPNGDGGYLIPNDLDGIEACFSPGVAMVSEFELACLEKGMKVFMADKSVEKPNLDISEDQYDFQKKFIGCTNNEDYLTMDNWVKSSGVNTNSDLMLQMDIEGAEYESIINMSDELISRFRIMVFEFHYLFNFWDLSFYKIAKTVFDKIGQTHICVHIHPNNCCGSVNRFGIDIPDTAEFTFIRKDRVNIIGFQNEFPHKLDFDNHQKDTIILSKDWYKCD